MNLGAVGVLAVWLPMGCSQGICAVELFQRDLDGLPGVWLRHVFALETQVPK